MKRTLLLCSFALLASLLSAQKIYFIYLQTETGEPFFVRMNDKLYSSESSGYLILPRLKDSTYKFKLGFPSKDVDLDFTTSINKKDHGYLVKNLGDKGWGLFDLQSLDLQMSASSLKKETGFDNSTNTNTPVNAFTALLAKATDDPSLRQNAVFAKEVEKKPEVVQAIEKEEKKPVVTDAVAKEEKKPDQVTQRTGKPDDGKADLAATNNQKEDSQRNSVNQNDLYKRSDVIKLSESSGAKGYESVYVDQNFDGAKDTIRVFIPVDKTAIAVKEEPKIDSATATKNSDTSASTAQATNKAKEEPRKEDKKWWQISIGKNKTEAAKEESKNDLGIETKKIDTPSDTSQAVSKAKEEPKKEETKKWWQIAFGKDKTETTDNKKCQTIANSDDFLKLRRKMAARTNDDGMLDEARKYFKSTCFSTEQVKNLSTMFLSNAGKFNFFTVAYNYTTDVENFSSLQSELKDEAYINRFKELVHN
jgi:Domain of unknown function (DUF4476)